MPIKAYHKHRKETSHQPGIMFLYVLIRHRGGTGLPFLLQRPSPLL